MPPFRPNQVANSWDYKRCRRLHCHRTLPRSRRALPLAHAHLGSTPVCVVRSRLYYFSGYRVVQIVDRLWTQLARYPCVSRNTLFWKFINLIKQVGWEWFSFSHILEVCWFLAKRDGSRSWRRLSLVWNSRIALSSNDPPHFKPNAMRPDFKRSKPTEASSLKSIIRAWFWSQIKSPLPPKKWIQTDPNRRRL